MAVRLGYKKVFRDPMGYPEWQRQGHPTAVLSAGTVREPIAAAGSGPLAGWAMFWTLLGIFAGGMALNLTPCVYPLIPITVSYFGGQATANGSSRSRTAVHALCYLLGLTVTNSVLGVVAALTGGLMGAMLQNPLVLISVALILVVFASSLFGFWEIRLPGALNRAATKSYGGYFGSLFMGITLGLVAAPCIGPFVLGLLTWVASLGSPWLGFVIFFTLSLGLGIPLFLLALFAGQMQKLPRSGDWMIWVRKLMGWVLVGMAVYFLKPLISELWRVFLPALVALAAGLHLGWIDRSRAGFRAFGWIKPGVGLAGLMIAVVLVGSWLTRGPGVTWQAYSDNLLDQAQQLERPVILDFYATWCAPCRELDETTFHDAAVVAEAGRRFVMIKVDVTRSGNPLHERLLAQYDVKGVPTVVFLDRTGQERKDLRLVDFLPPVPFLARMRQIQ